MKCSTIAATTTVALLALSACGLGRSTHSIRLTKATNGSGASTTAAAPPTTTAPADSFHVGDCALVKGGLAKKLPCNDPLATHRVTELTVTSTACPPGTDETFQLLGSQPTVAGVVCFALGTVDRGTANDGVIEVGSCIATTGAVAGVGGTPVEAPCDDPSATEKVISAGTFGDACPAAATATLTSGVRQFCLAKK